MSFKGKKLPFPRISAINAAFLAGTIGMVSPSSVDAQSKADLIHLGKTFKMEVQIYPFLEPTNPLSREVTVDCDKLDVSSRGYVAYTGSFVDIFDIPPLRQKNPSKGDIFEGAAAMGHIGGGIDDRHMICRAQALVQTGKSSDSSQPYSFKAGNNTYYTPVPYSDNRYCPVLAAFALCTKTTVDDANLSPVYNVNPQNGNVTLNHTELNNVINPPYK